MSNLLQQKINQNMTLSNREGQSLYGTDVEFTYDGMGRRLTKTVTETSGTDTLETTYKYHYLGGQITTIDIDQTTTNDSEPPVTSTTRDETIHIHLGPNSQPISFEWVRYDYANSTTLDDTYYYHYDIHGNVIKITDEDGDQVCFYEYDVRGNITTESNPDSIPNFFKWGGINQTLHDNELGMYFNSGFYDPSIGRLMGDPPFPTAKDWAAVKEADAIIGLAGMIAQYVGPYYQYLVGQEVNDFRHSGFHVHMNFWYVTGVQIRNQAMASLINSMGDKVLRGGRGFEVSPFDTLSRSQWIGGLLRTCDNRWVRACNYFTDARDDAFAFAGIAQANFNKGAMRYTHADNDRPFGELAGVLFQAQCRFDAKHGAGAYKSDEFRFRYFLEVSKFLINDLGQVITSTMWYIKRFEKTYGKLQDTDGDGIPDFVDIEIDKKNNPNVESNYIDLNLILKLNSIITRPFGNTTHYVPPEGIAPVGYGSPQELENNNNLDDELAALKRDELPPSPIARYVPGTEPTYVLKYTTYRGNEIPGLPRPGPPEVGPPKTPGFIIRN